MRSALDRRAIAALTAAAAALALGCNGRPRETASVAPTGTSPTSSAPAGRSNSAVRRPTVGRGFTVQVLRIVERQQPAHGQRAGPARTLITYLRLPTGGAAPHPLIVFGHGFDSTPARYAGLLDAWARAGYVVAAPLFPHSNPTAPLVEADIVNQPADMSAVISGLLAADSDPASPLHGLIDARAIAVAGHSDGAETAWAVAEDPAYRDARVRAAIALAGATLPSRRVRPVRGALPLLLTQGSGDTVHPAALTSALWALTPRPAYLLTLLGAGHLRPYVAEQPQLAIVERVTIAFLDRYLRGERMAERRLVRAGDVPGIAALQVRG